MTWTLEILKKTLHSQKEILSWRILKKNTHRIESYFIHASSSTWMEEQARQVDQEQITLLLYTRTQEPKKLGTTQLLLRKDLPLESQIQKAIGFAQTATEPLWHPPQTPQGPVPTLQTADPLVLENPQKAHQWLSHQCAAALPQKKGFQFNSAELFTSIHFFETHFPSGAIDRYKQSCIFFETAYSFEKSEFLSYQSQVERDALKPNAFLDQLTQNASLLSKASSPPSGTYWVLLKADVLAEFLSSCLSQLSSHNVYYQLPHRPQGEPFIPNAREGDLISITLDPHLPKGAATRALSVEGQLQKPLALVKDNKVCSHLTSLQLAELMDISPSTTEGNLILSSGSLTLEQMRSFAPSILEIEQFSAPFIDPMTATFSSEIRLGKLWKNQGKEMTPIRRGSASISLFKNFQKAFFSKETTRFFSFNTFVRAQPIGYLGPKYALISQVPIASSNTEK